MYHFNSIFQSSACSILFCFYFKSYCILLYKCYSIFYSMLLQYIFYFIFVHFTFLF